MSVIFGLYLTSDVEKDAAGFDDLNKEGDGCRPTINGRDLARLRI